MLHRRRIEPSILFCPDTSISCDYDDESINSLTNQFFKFSNRDKINQYNRFYGKIFNKKKFS